MRYLILILILSSCSTADPDRSRRLKLAEFSYSSGCYQASIHVCEKYIKAPEKFVCYEEMNMVCPKAAKEFRNWLESRNT